MKKLILFLTFMLFFTGCVSTFWEEGKTLIPQKDGTTNTLYSVHVSQKAFWSKSDISQLSIPYHGSSISLGKFSTKGDTELTKEVGNIIIYSLAAYGSMGSVPALQAVLNAFESGKAQKVLDKINNNQPVFKEDFQ